MSDCTRMSDLSTAHLLVAEVLRHVVLEMGAAPSQARPQPDNSAEVADLQRRLTAEGQRVDELYDELARAYKQIKDLTARNRELSDLLPKKPADPAPVAVVNIRPVMDAPVQPTAFSEAPVTRKSVEPDAAPISPVEPAISAHRLCVCSGKEVISRSGRHTCSQSKTAKVLGKLGDGSQHFIDHLADDFGFRPVSTLTSALHGVSESIAKIGLEVVVDRDAGTAQMRAIEVRQ